MYVDYALHVLPSQPQTVLEMKGGSGLIVFWLAAIPNTYQVNAFQAVARVFDSNGTLKHVAGVASSVDGVWLTTHMADGDSLGVEASSGGMGTALVRL